MTKGFHILLAEDNDGDVLLLQEALEEVNPDCAVSVVKNGKEALDFIFKRGIYSDATTPNLVIIDINLPLHSGHEVLHEMKQDAETRIIPVIVLTTSSSVHDIDQAYHSHANCYIIKPIDLEELYTTIKVLNDFWIKVAVLPTKP